MVRVLVKGNHNGDASSWVLVELQGEIGISNPDKNNLDLATISLEDGNERATLEIGHHRLFGKRQALSKPFAVCQLQKQTQGSSPSSTCCVLATIREKVIFKDRPTPILTPEQKMLTSLR